MNWRSKLPAYERLSVGHADEGDSAETTDFSRIRSLRSSVFTHFNIGFLVANLLLLSANVWLASKEGSTNWLLKKTTTHTPLLDRFEFSFERRTPNASLFNNPYSIYKADPSPEADEAWEYIADTPVFAITKDDIVKMGKDPEYAVQLPEEFGYGKEMYAAANDGQHLIHCINEVRKYAHYDYYYYPKYGPSKNGTALPALHRAHRSHCIAMILEALKCQPSLNMVTWEWMEGQETPWPDFDVTRKCVDYNAFLQWQVDSQLPREKLAAVKWKKAEGQKEKPIEPELKKIQEDEKGGDGGHDEHAGHDGLGHGHEHPADAGTHS